MKTTTIRKLLTVAVAQALQQEHLLKSEQEELVEYIMDNSTLAVSSNDEIDLYQGNCFGIGDTNKDRELQTPRYCVFSFTRSRLADFHSSWVQAVSLMRCWRLVSMPDFQRVENYIRSNYDKDTYIAVLVAEEPLSFTVLKDADTTGDIWVPVCSDIHWVKPIFKLNFKQESAVYEEKFNSKGVLESRILQLIAGNAECVRALSIMDCNKHLGFRVAGNVCQSGGKPETSDRNVYILWDNPQYEDDDDGYKNGVPQTGTTRETSSVLEYNGI